VREFFFALNKNATTTRDNDPLTPLFLFFLLRESSRIFLLTQPQGLKDQLPRKKAEETTAEKNTKNSKKQKFCCYARDISRTIIIIIIIIIIIKRSSSRSEETGRERERNLSSLFR
jgi:hypothetical protein